MSRTLKKCIYLCVIAMFYSITSSSQISDLTRDFTTDSTGCLGLRLAHVHEVLDSVFKKSIRKKTEIEVTRLLGKPNDYVQGHLLIFNCDLTRNNHIKYNLSCNGHSYLLITFRRKTGKAIRMFYKS